MKKKHKVIVIVAGVLAAVTIVVALLAPSVVRWGVGKALAPRYQSFTIGDVSVNIFTGRIELDDVEASNADAGGIAVGQAVVNIDLLPVVRKHVHIAIVSLSDTTVKIRQMEDGSWSVAGIQLNKEGGPVGQQGKGEELNWNWSVGKIALNNILISVLDKDSNKSSVALNADTGQVDSEEGAPVTPFHMTAMLQKGSIELDGEAQLFGDTPVVSGTVKIQELDLGAMAPYLAKVGIENFGALLNMDLKANVGPDPESGASMVKTDGSLSLSGLTATYVNGTSSIDLRNGGLIYNGSASYVMGHGPGTQGKLMAEGSVVLTSLSASQPGSSRALMGLERFTLSGIKLSGIDEMTGEGAVFSGITFFEYDPKSTGGAAILPQALAVNEIKISGISLSSLKQLDIKDISVKGADAFVFFNKAGKLEPMASLAGLLGGKAPEEKKQDEEGLRATVGRITLEGENRFVVHDLGTEPRLTFELSPITANIEGVDTSGKEQATVELKSGVGRSGRFSAHGKLLVFGPKIGSDMKGELSDVNLPDLNPYLIRHYSYRVKSGRIDVKDVKVNIANDKLDAQMDIRLHKLNVEKAEAGGKHDADKVLGMPLRSALSMMTDDDGVIRIDIKIEGSLSDPEFEVREVLRTAVLNAVKKGAVSYFGPLGVQLLTGIVLPTGALQVAKSFYDHLTAVRFDPVTFSPGEAVIPPKQHERLDQMADLLKDRPDVQLVICGITVPADHENMLTGGTAAKEGAAKTAGKSSAEEILLGLADKRAEAVADYLTSKGIDRERLFICAPEISEAKDDVPRAEVGI